ncbi:complement receptor type 1 isoform X1 [Gymnodraco acuticeps]|uniref:Complement receptor type 1 isoform X1 n=1 Tax=Gymnodraco acuticeps TaxID=8218 RepID=A0A6P8ULN1_GYMAC|nr:complement receptor type 1 isoform X1 [Gymnodraco acuticeps]
MRNIGLNILLLSFALGVSAQLPKQCSAPPEYQHARLVNKYSGLQKFLSGEKVYYECAEDFTPSEGSRAAQCVAGGWSKLTLKCEKKSCGNAGDLPHGEFQYEGNSFIGEKAYAVCNEGYSLKGLDYIICKKSGWTSDIPYCEEGEATCPPPAVARHLVSSAGAVSVHRVGVSVTFTCSHGFQLDGAQSIRCGAGGLWQPPPPRCRPAPNKTLSPNEGTGRCRVPVNNDNTNLADRYIRKTLFASGDKVYYVCDVGYVQAGGSRHRMCIEGQWTPLKLKCQRKSCGSAGEIMNGEFTYTGLEFGDKATAVCEEGYRLVGKATRNCLSKGWDARVPACEAVVCEEPSTVTNAEMRGRHEPPYTYRTVISYHCRAGTLIGQRNIWCTKDGTWSNAPPECREVSCPSPNVANAYWMRAQNKQFQERDILSIECEWGYTMSGPSSITCGHDGRWSPGLPKCTLSPTGGANKLAEM